MRPIDADALIERMYHEAFETDSDMQRWDSGCWIRYKLFENVLDEQPTIEPEREKGEWIPQDHNKHHGMISTTVYCFPRCSVCGESANYTSFCPNCGADMRGEQDDARSL